MNPMRPSAEGNEHPMENNLILREVFKLVPRSFDAVKTLRRVSKAFYWASNPEWKSFTTPLTIFTDEAMRRLHESNTVGATTTLAAFLKKEAGPKQSEYPPRNFVLKNWNLKSCHYTGSGSSDGQSGEDLHRIFWFLHGEKVTVLTLSDCKLPWSAKLFEDALLKALPNLERVSLLNCTLVGGPVAYVRTATGVTHFQCSAVYNMYSDFFEDSCVARAPTVRSLRVDNVRFQNKAAVIPWSTLFKMFPNLEELWVAHQPGNGVALAKALASSNPEQKLRKLDIMNAGPSVRCFQWKHLSLEKLAIRCDYPPTALHLEGTLPTEWRGLGEFPQYPSMLGTPYPNFLCNCYMPSLTELHILGNVLPNLDFLQNTPNLRVLKWNTPCYDEHKHGDNSLKYKRHKSCSAKRGKRIVKSSRVLPMVFQLQSMRTLEFDRNPVSLEFWQQLGEWMPDLTRLKCLVASDQHLALLGRMWPELQHIEMAHGSLLSSGAILQAFSAKLSLQRLKSFIWKPCACLNFAAKKNSLWNEEDIVEVENVFQERANGVDAPIEIILPWDHIESASSPSVFVFRACMN